MKDAACALKMVGMRVEHSPSGYDYVTHGELLSWLRTNGGELEKFLEAVEAGGGAVCIRESGLRADAVLRALDLQRRA